MPEKSRPRARTGSTRRGATEPAGAPQPDTTTAGTVEPDAVEVPLTAGQAPRRSPGPRIRPKNVLDRYFSIRERRSTVARDVRGGLVTFFTM